MGVISNISHDTFPKQGALAGQAVDVLFHFDMSNVIKATCIRNDVEQPGVTIFKLSDGRVVLARECQFIHKATTSPPDRAVTDKEARLEAALESLLAEVVNMREDYPAEAWRFSDEAIADAESAIASTVANRTSILGAVEFLYSDNDKKCICCPDGRHAHSRGVRLDDWESPAPAHFPRDPSQFVRDFAAKHEHVGKRVKICVEILE